MSLSAAAAALGLPEALVERSAAARAAEAGVSVDEILAAWAGGETVGGPAPPAAAEAAPPQEPEPVSVTPEPATPAMEATAPAPAAGPAPVVTRAPIPTEVSVAQASQLPEVITVPTAGIRERTNFTIPRWLTAVMIVAPLFALFALGGAATGACGEGTELATDVITGKIVNCDGSEFTGGGAGGGGTDFISLGGDVFAGNVTTAATCFGCHGSNGEGVGTFPALTGVTTTFSACADHIQWVRLGSDGWRSQVGENFGDTNKPVTQGMPSHASLTDEQLASVVAFERVRFGGADPDQTLTDCGLVEAAPEEGASDGASGDGGETPVSTTVPSG